MEKKPTWTFPNLEVPKEDIMFFILRMADEGKEGKEAFMARIEQLYREYVDAKADPSVDSDYVTAHLMKLFCIGYQLGWTDKGNSVKYENILED